ncbi:hypothetical protein TIFTF001_056337, partial [Ficus carica]
ARVARGASRCSSIGPRFAKEVARVTDWAVVAACAWLFFKLAKDACGRDCGLQTKASKVQGVTDTVNQPKFSPYLATCLHWSKSAGNRHPHVQSGQVSRSHGLLGLTHAHWIFRTATPPNQAVNARSHAQLTLSDCLAESGSTQGHANARHPLASRTQWPWW